MRNLSLLSAEASKKQYLTGVKRPVVALYIENVLMWRTGGPLFLRLCSHNIANACAVSHYISYSDIDTVLSTFPNTIVRECAEFLDALASLAFKLSVSE